MRITNKKALHNYHILEHIEVGIVLSGAEVKSIRAVQFIEYKERLIVATSYFHVF